MTQKIDLERYRSLLDFVIDQALRMQESLLRRVYSEDVLLKQFARLVYI